MLEKIVQPIANVLRFHKLKIFVALLSALFFAVIIFPYEDLADVITAKVAEATQNQVYLQFDDLGISLIPSPSVEMSEVKIDTPVLPQLKANALYLSPSITSLLTFKPGFTAKARGFLDGDMDLSVRTGEKVSDNARAQNIDLGVYEIDLNELTRVTDSPVSLNGRANMDLTLMVDPTFVQQPDGDVQLTAAKLQLPPSTVPTPFGPMALPNIAFSDVTLKGRLSDGQLIIEQGQLGSREDALSGRIEGRVATTLQRRGVNVVPLFGAYELKVELLVSRAAEKDLGLFLGFLDKYKTPTNTGSRFAFKATGVRFGAPPNMTPLSSF